jgi:hypothetical protein
MLPSATSVVQGDFVWRLGKWPHGLWEWTESVLWRIAVCCLHFATYLFLWVFVMFCYSFISRYGSGVLSLLAG